MDVTDGWMGRMDECDGWMDGMDGKSMHDVKKASRLAFSLKLTEAKYDVRKVVKFRRGIKEAHAIRRDETDRRGRCSGSGASRN